MGSTVNIILRPRGPSGGPQGSSGGPQGAGPKIVVGISNRFYVVLGPLLAPTPNFLQIRWKTQKLKIVIIGRVWLVRLVGKKWLYAFDVHIGFLSLKKSRMGRNIGYQFWCINSFYVVFGTLLAPIPNLIKIRWKTQKLKIFTIGRFWLVGLVGQKMVERISNSFYAVFEPSLTPIPNFIQIGWKTQKLKIFTIGRFWLVGLVGRKMVVGISNSPYVVFAP